MLNKQNKIKLITSSLLVVVLLSGLSFSFAAAQDKQLPGTGDNTTEGEGGLGAGDPTGGESSTSTGGLPDIPGNIPTEPQQIIQNILNWTMGVIASVAVLFVVIGGFRYTTSAGNQQLIEGAKKMIRNAIIGLVIAILALVIVNTIGQALLFGNGVSTPPTGATPPIVPTP